MISGCFSNKKEDSGYDIVWKLKDIINEEIIDADLTIDSPLITDSATDNMVTISKSGYYKKVGVVPLVYGQKNLIGYLTKESSTIKYSISGKISDENGGALSNAGVVVFGNFIPKRVYTDLNGIFKIDYVPEGEIKLYVYKNDYTYTIGEFNLTSNLSNVQYNIDTSSGSKYGDVYGTIKGYNSEICGNSYVSFGVIGSGVYQYGYSDSQGGYYLYGIPYGTITMNVKSPGFYKINSSDLLVNSVSKNSNISMTIISGE